MARRIRSHLFGSKELGASTQCMLCENIFTQLLGIHHAIIRDKALTSHNLTVNAVAVIVPTVITRCTWKQVK